ncbi:MAG TPA: hypothetical protein VMS71_01500 [Candidatus Acidoferrum sp.]|nr:hypothetical protein [Candidatus Acidoferrum sp.]
MRQFEQGAKTGSVIKTTALALILLLTFTISGLADERASGVGAYDYGLLDLYQYHETDSLKLEHTVGFTAGWQIGKSHFVYEWQRPLISFVTFRGRLNKERGVATVGVMAAALSIPATLMELAGSNEDQIESILFPVLAPFGSHIGYRPIRAITVYAGVIPDFILFTESNGLLIQARTGIRIDLKLGFVASIGYMKPIFRGFRSPSRSFPAGVTVGISYAPISGSWGY